MTTISGRRSPKKSTKGLTQARSQPAEAPFCTNPDRYSIAGETFIKSPVKKCELGGLVYIKVNSEGWDGERRRQF